MARKTNFNDVAIAYLGGSVASVATGLVGSYLLVKAGYRVDVGSTVAATWLTTIGVPSCLVFGRSIARSLGERDPYRISVQSSTKLQRSIPWNVGGSARHVFAFAFPDGPRMASEIETNAFTVNLGSGPITLAHNEVEDFLRATWRRQLSGKAGLSRRYHCTTRRPRLEPVTYNAMIVLLLSVDGLVIDRGERRSGKLALPPGYTLNTLLGHLA
jgi:hypothetical protein